MDDEDLPDMDDLEGDEEDDGDHNVVNQEPKSATSSPTGPQEQVLYLPLSI